MNCPSCGTENPEGTKFCAGCGTNLQNQTPVTTYETQPQYTAPQPQYAAPQHQYYAQPVTPAVPNIPDEYKPIGAWMYFLWNIVFSIPLVGFVLLIVFSCGGTSNINLRNYARSFFCALLVGVVFVILMTILGVSVFSAIAEMM